MTAMRILVVEDDPSVRDALRRALMLAGYEVGLAEGGQQALTQVAAGVPDLIVLDIGLPTAWRSAAGSAGRVTACRS
jgi:two-component system, OmpR family, response regulator MprA